jgi:hypothetical protein
MSRDLKDVVWNLAGWGSHFCEFCQSIKMRMSSISGPYTVCTNSECVTNKLPDRPCWESEDE